MNVTLATGILTQTLDDGTTYTVNLKNVTDFQVLVRQTPVAPTTLVNPIELNQTYTFDDQYVVRLSMNDNRFTDIVMETVDNQDTWVNTEAGANIARAAIVASI
jgi:hypothetical protein